MNSYQTQTNLFQVEKSQTPNDLGPIIYVLQQNLSGLPYVSLKIGTGMGKESSYKTICWYNPIPRAL